MERAGDRVEHGHSQMKQVCRDTFPAFLCGPLSMSSLGDFTAMYCTQVEHFPLCVIISGT